MADEVLGGRLQRGGGADLLAFDDPAVDIDQTDVAVLVAQVQPRHHVHALFDQPALGTIRESFAMFLHGSPFSFRSMEGFGITFRPSGLG